MVFLFEGHVCPRCALVLALPGNPGAQAAELAPQRLDLAHAAALGVAIAIETEQPLLANHRLNGPGCWHQQLDGDVVVLAHALDVRVGFGVQATRVQRKDINGQTGLVGHVDQHHVFRATERNCHLAVSIAAGDVPQPGLGIVTDTGFLRIHQACSATVE